MQCKTDTKKNGRGATSFLSEIFASYMKGTHDSITVSCKKMTKNDCQKVDKRNIENTESHPCSLMMVK